MWGFIIKHKNTFLLSMAYVGVLVGAGFASGQEMMQYFVVFGKQGIYGAVLSLLFFAATGLMLLQIASYYQANEHRFVFRKMMPHWLAFVFDLLIIFTLFSIGVVMIAGSGANMQQQFGIPVHWGSLLMSSLIFITAFINIEKVSKVIAALSPIMIILLLFSSMYIILQGPKDFSVHAAYVATNPPQFSHWSLSSLNYVAMSLSVGVSMAIVMGGEEIHPSVAGRGGLIGGVIIGFLVLIMSLALYFVFPKVYSADFPLLAMLQTIHPFLAWVSSWVILAMIFNTGVSMFYALSARFSTPNTPKFKFIFAITLILAYFLSFLGFKKLVAILYPMIGYAGMIFILMLIKTWFEMRQKISMEAKRRKHIEALVYVQEDERLDLCEKEENRLEDLLEASNLDNQYLEKEIQEEVINKIKE